MPRLFGCWPERITISLRGPSAPRMRVISMSEVADGPEMVVTASPLRAQRDWHAGQGEAHPSVAFGLHDVNRFRLRDSEIGPTQPNRDTTLHTRAAGSED